MELKYPDKKVGIICTIGPASWDEDVMRSMIKNGMNIARVNGAFADRDEMLRVENLVKGISEKVELMIDVKGPEVRMNKFDEVIDIFPGDELEIGSDNSSKIYPANNPTIYKKLSKGQRIVVGDGDVVLEVIDILEKSFRVKVVAGSKLKPGKALNFPGFNLDEPPLTENDRNLLDYAIERGWEFVSASFIKDTNSAKFIRDYIEGSKIKFIAKIEDNDGVRNIRDIAPKVDMIMVARGGLGVDMGLETVGISQKKIMDAAREFNVPAIVATQMLESMAENPYPTRAETNDVATALFMGASYLMLSIESSMGKHPVEAVEFLSKVDAEYAKYIKELA